MRKVLIVSNLLHSFPRISNIAYYLPLRNWTPYLLTPPLPGDVKERLDLPSDFFERVKLLETSFTGDVFSSLRKVLQLTGIASGESTSKQLKEKAGTKSAAALIDLIIQYYQAFLAFPDTEKKWIKPALARAESAHSQIKFDAIFSSNPHPSVNVIARKLRSALQLPWVADFRDLWSQNHNYSYPLFRFWLDSTYEKIILKEANILTTVSDGFVDTQTRFLGRDLIKIRNGFDPRWLQLPPPSLTKKFTITYCGSVYEGRQDYNLLLRNMAALVSEGLIDNNKIELRFVGCKSFALEQAVASSVLAGCVRFIPPVPRKDLFQLQGESQLLLVFDWEDRVRQGVLPLKLFDYLSARRPIFATGNCGNDEFSSILSQTKAGNYMQTDAQIREALLGYYREYLDKGQVAYTGDLPEIKQFGYDLVAKEFAAVLDTLVSAESK